MVHSMVFQSKALDIVVLSSFAYMNIKDSGVAGRTTRWVIPIFKKVVTKSEVWQLVLLHISANCSALT